MSRSRGDESPIEIRDYDLDDDLWRATAADAAARVNVYTPPETMVVLGRGSRPEVELEVERCLEDDVLVTRRRGGGCSVVLDVGNVIVATTLAVKGFGENQAHFDRLTSWLIDGLAKIGFPGVGRAGTSDLVVGDRKVGGSCIYRARNVLLFSSTLLVDPEVELMERYLAHPPREPEYRGGRRHRDFISRLMSSEPSSRVEDVVGKLENVLRPSTSL